MTACPSKRIGRGSCEHMMCTWCAHGVEMWFPVSFSNVHSLESFCSTWSPHDGHFVESWKLDSSGEAARNSCPWCQWLQCSKVWWFLPDNHGMHETVFKNSPEQLSKHSSTWVTYWYICKLNALRQNDKTLKTLKEFKRSSKDSLKPSQKSFCRSRIWVSCVWPWTDLVWPRHYLDFALIIWVLCSIWKRDLIPNDSVTDFPSARRQAQVW